MFLKVKSMNCDFLNVDCQNASQCLFPSLILLIYHQVCWALRLQLGATCSWELWQSLWLPFRACVSLI